MTNIMIVDDSFISKRMLELELSKRKDEYEIIYIIDSAENAILLCRQGNVDVILMDVCTEGDSSGIEAAKKIKKEYPDIKIIIITSMAEYSFIEKAKKAGCESFWYKDDGKRNILEVIALTLEGESIYPDSSPEIMIGMAKSSEFTEAEFRVLEAFVEDLSYAGVAKRCNISENTVRYHVRNLMQKTGKHTMAAIVMEVVGKSLILPKH